MQSFRIHRKLQNGQHLAMYFTKTHQGNGVSSWIIGLCIGKTRKACNDWFNKDSDRQKTVLTTGKCGLEGLRMALQILLETESQIPKGDYLIVFWLDKRRERAYSRLLRYGYSWGYDAETEDEEPCCLFKIVGEE